MIIHRSENSVLATFDLLDSSQENLVASTSSSSSEDSNNNGHCPRHRGRIFGRFRGFILRWQLIVLLREKVFNETSMDRPPSRAITASTFRKFYPRYPPIESVIPTITAAEREYTIDLRPVMNPSPYSVSYAASLPRIFRLFRALGLRHLVVVNDRNMVIGMVTRKDLARYRSHWSHGKMALQELQISIA